jgi:hypothetical protein
MRDVVMKLMRRSRAARFAFLLVTWPVVNVIDRVQRCNPPASFRRGLEWARGEICDRCYHANAAHRDAGRCFCGCTNDRAFVASAPYSIEERPRVSGAPACEHGYSTRDVGGIPVHIGTGKLCGGGNPNLATEEFPGGEAQ